MRPRHPLPPHPLVCPAWGFGEAAADRALPRSCCCFHPTRPQLYLAAGNRIVEYDLVTGAVPQPPTPTHPTAAPHRLGAHAARGCAPLREQPGRASGGAGRDGPALLCRAELPGGVAAGPPTASTTPALRQRALIARANLQDQFVRVYKELALHGGNGLRPVLQHRCTRQGRDEWVGSSALSHSSRATFFFGKVGRANVYAIDAFAEEAACEIVKVAGAKRALKTEPYELVCHPTKPVFVAVSDAAAIVGNSAQVLFQLEGGKPDGNGKLHSVCFHSSEPWMLGIRGSYIMCWDASDATGFRLLATVPTAAPVRGVYFLPGVSRYFCSLALGSATEGGSQRGWEVTPWYFVEEEQQPLQKATALNTAALTGLAEHYCADPASPHSKWGLFPHGLLPLVVAVGRSSFSIVRCIDRLCPSTVSPTAARIHLSLDMIEIDGRSAQQPQNLPPKLYFMAGCRLWSYGLASERCEAEDETLTLPAAATAVGTLERHEGGAGESILATVSMEFGGGSRAAFFSLPGVDATRQRGCRDAALVNTAHWLKPGLRVLRDVQHPPERPVGVVAAVISEDGLSLTFEGRLDVVADCAGPHALGCPVNRVFSSPFSQGKALLYVDGANSLRFSRNRASSDESAGSGWAVWEEGPAIRLHGDESVVSATWQEGSALTGPHWSPVLALVTSRRAMLLSDQLEVMAHAEVEAGSSAPLSVPSGIWCGVVFLYTTATQIRWLALDGTDGGLVSLPQLNAAIVGATLDRVFVLCPDGFRTFVQVIPVGLYEPLAVGWIVASAAGQVELATAVAQISALGALDSGELTVSAGLLRTIAQLPPPGDDLRSSPQDDAARKRLQEIGLGIAFSEATGHQFPLELRLTIALRCSAYRQGYDALRKEWIRQSEPPLASGSPLGRLFEELAAACRSCGESEIESECRSVLRNTRDPAGQPQGGGPKSFADVLAMQAELLPSAAALPSADGDRLQPAVDPPATYHDLSLLAGGLPLHALGAGRRNWDGMTGSQVRVDAGSAMAATRDPAPGPGLQLGASASADSRSTSNPGTPSEHSQSSMSVAAHSSDSSDDEGGGRGALRSAAQWEIERFSSSDDEDDSGGINSRNRKITIEIKDPARSTSTASRSSVSAILGGATSLPMSPIPQTNSTSGAGGSPGGASQNGSAPPVRLSLNLPPQSRAPKKR